MTTGEIARGGKKRNNAGNLRRATNSRGFRGAGQRLTKRSTICLRISLQLSQLDKTALS